jgi:DNA-binding response OmpR family regulator
MVDSRSKELTMTAHVLLIDDDAVVVSTVEAALIQDGHRVSVALPGVDALRRMIADEPDLVILGIDSQDSEWQFCRRLLAFLDQPLLLLLPVRNKLDHVKGLELGADDCMVKPVLTVELLARVRALLRRSALAFSRRQRSLFMDGDLIVDLTRREVLLNGYPVAITPTEFRMLTCFIMHEGEVLPHERILTQVWGPSDLVGRDVLKLYIHNLRKKLEPNPNQPQRLLTRRGEGYLFRRLTEHNDPKSA